MIPAPALLNEVEAAELAAAFEGRPPQALLQWALARYGALVALSTSLQAEGMVLLDMAWRIDPSVRVFTLDTGRMHQQTYDLVDQVRARYGIVVDISLPDSAQVQALTAAHGVNLFYNDVQSRLRCCEVRKVIPLAAKLKACAAWITGLRRDQWSSRASIRCVEIDRDHGGIAKLSPLAGWTSEQVWEYIRANDVPYHQLYDQGYTSIGCAPCTRATRPGEDPRAGRWWWEEDAPKECGIHLPDVATLLRARPAQPAPAPALLAQP